MYVSLRLGLLVLGTYSCSGRATKGRDFQSDPRFRWEDIGCFGAQSMEGPRTVEGNFGKSQNRCDYSPGPS